MKRIIINDYQLGIEDIDYEEIRVKGFIMNSQKEIYLIENNYTYQFPGGHLKDNESLEECLIREIEEEMGISLTIDQGPFLMITTFDNDYFQSGSKVMNKIYYYVISTDKDPDVYNLNLDTLERQTDFHIVKINIYDLDSFLNKCMEDGKINSNIYREMLIASKEYKNLIGGNL